MLFNKKLMGLLFFFLLTGYVFCRDNYDDLTLKSSVDKINKIISLGNLSINYLGNYNVGIYDGINAKHTYLIDSPFKDLLHITYFNKNKYFDGADSQYTSNRFHLLDQYINGNSADMSNFSRFGAFRRNFINNIEIAERFLLSESIMINIEFRREICIINNDYVFIVSIVKGEIKEQFIKAMPKYFFIDDNIDFAYPVDKPYYRWLPNKENELYDIFKEYKQLPDSINNLFIETDLIVNSIIIN
jgi:hypothetical protein